MCATAPWSRPSPSGASTSASVSSGSSSASVVASGSRGDLTATIAILVPRFSRSPSLTFAAPVYAYTSTRDTFAGRVLSVFVLGTVNRRSTTSPRRCATRSPGGDGNLTRGGSGGPLRPHAITETHSATTINTHL